MVNNTATRATSPPVNPLQTSIVTSSSSLQQYQSFNNGNTSHSITHFNSKQFRDNFWGEKINGFDILCQNLKHSLTSVKDLETFLRESANCEDSYGKVLNKLVSQINRFSTNGSFNPLWMPLKELNERYAFKHVEMVHNLHEKIKEIQQYNDELSKRIKKIRESEISTQNTVQNFQDVQLNLNKTKEQYHNLCIEFEKQKRQLDPQQLAQYQQQQLQQQISSTNLLSAGGSSNAGLLSSVSGGSGVNSMASSSLQPLLNTNNSISGNINIQQTGNVIGQSQSASPAPVTTTTDRLSSLASSITVSKVSQVQKTEKKLRLALEEYKQTIEKYNLIRVKFERELGETCNNFQLAEENHLKQMRGFIDSYSRLVAGVNANKQVIYNEFQAKFEQLTTEYLLQMFVENKRTGMERPEAAQFIDQYDYAKNVPSQNGLVVSPSNSHSSNNNNNQTIINETDFNLFINGGNQFTNTSLNASYSSSSLLPPPPPPMPSASQPSFSHQQLVNTNDLIDNKLNNGNDFGSSNNSSQSRGTPIFFNPASIMGSNSFYSPLTNSVSTTTLNSQPTSSAVGSNLTGSNLLTASPINFQQSLISPSNGVSAAVANSGNVSSTTAILPATTPSENMKRSDSKGINIFNVDFLGRNKNKEKKAAQKAAAAAAAAAAVQEQQSSSNKSKPSKTSKKNKQNLSSTTITGSTLGNSQYENLNSTTATFTNGGLSVSNNSNRDSSSINSEDSNEQRIADSQQQQQQQQQGSSNPVDSTNPGSITARSISSITGSLSFDLLDQLKISNGSDIDSEGYSIRPESSIGLRRKKKDEPLRNKDNDDMNNLYASSTTNSDSDDSDSENGGSSGGPIKVNIKIKPKSELNPDETKKQNNDDVLREISKNLQLIKPTNGALQFNNKQQQIKKRTYYYNYGTSNPDQASSGWSTSSLMNSNDNSLLNTDTIKQENDNIAATAVATASIMTRSVSVGSVPNSNQLIADFALFHTQTSSPNSQAAAITTIPPSSNKPASESLFDFGISFPAKQNQSNPQASVPVSMSLNKVTAETNNLYNIEEDKEVETSFQYDLKRVSQQPTVSSSPANVQQPVTGSVTVNQSNGRFTPACFPGRTTPDFRITTSLFEQQSTRASIISPLTVNPPGCDLIPIAVAFNETIHAYFKTGDTSKFKVKCFGCMKISFPFAVLKYLNSELPLLEFRLSNLQIANQDLKINNQLLNKVDSDLNETLQFKFASANLVHELKQQHQQNKLAAFFNFELLKYEFKYSTTPLVLNANWNNNPLENTIELNLNYAFNFRKNLSQVNFMIVMPVASTSSLLTTNNTDKIALIKSEPKAIVQETEQKLTILWQMSTVNTNGSLTAKFSIPSSFTLNQSLNLSTLSTSSINPLEHYYQPVYVKFNIENETLSQVKFDILSSQYKLSLLKERIETGKYFCNNDHQQQQQQQQNITSQLGNSSADQLSQSLIKKPPFAGNLSTSIGSTFDIFLNS